jgi:radical SAM/Cys-rich protein
LKSLKSSHNSLSDSGEQVNILEQENNEEVVFPSFDQELKRTNKFPLIPVSIETLQVNVGKVCNQTCKHCHVDAAPDRKESMSRETFEQCLDVVVNNHIPVVDITGGAPEINPHFRWFVEELTKNKVHVISRCNLTIINSNKKYHDLPEFYAKNNVEVVSSLPYFTSMRTDSQRGKGVFDSSIKALKKLNDVGYGKNDSGLVLDLVYNPAGAFLPADQHTLEQQFKSELIARYEIEFNTLYCITNLPISRFLEYLLRTENYQLYMDKLISSFNPLAVDNVMCRSMISVGWDGKLYDCDFNQMLDLEVSIPGSTHISNFNPSQLMKRKIVTGRHCFGCTAGAGSSCGGEVVG